MQLSTYTQKPVAGARQANASASAVLRPVQPRQPVAARAAADGEVDAAVSSLTRRGLLLASGVALAAPALPVPQALADGGDYARFYGFATPPTSYGGYGGNAKEVPKYTFEYPAGWKEEVPSKVEKGTQGIDGRVVNPRVKGQRAVVITLSRAGEDNKSFRLGDFDNTFAGFAGADYDLQDALTEATEIKQSEREVDGTLFYLYDIDSPETTYLAAITVKAGKVFALFVKSPTRSFKANEAKLRHVVDTFTLL